MFLLTTFFRHFLDGFVQPYSGMHPNNAMWYMTHELFQPGENKSPWFTLFHFE